MAKFRTKEQVVADYKVNFLPHLQEKTHEAKVQCWDRLLEALHRDGLISEASLVKWKFPEEILK